jgi:hypothetical protein
VNGAADPEQSGVHPPCSQTGAEDFCESPDLEGLKAFAKINFPALAMKHVVLHLPALGEAWQQPEADGFIRIAGLDSQSDPGVGQAA